MPDSSGLTTSSLFATRPSDTTTLFDKPNTPLQATFEHSDMPRPHNSPPSGILRLFILLLQCRSHGDSYFITSIEPESTIPRHYPFNRRFSVILQPRHNGDYLWPISSSLTLPLGWALSLSLLSPVVRSRRSLVRTPLQRSLSPALITPNNRNTLVIVFYICLFFLSWLSTFEWG